MKALGGVGVVGLGAMGKGIAANLVRAGYPVIGCDAAAAACEDAAGCGVRIVDGPAAVARESSAALFSIVRTAGQTEEVLFGENGVVTSAPAGLPVIVASTIDPSTMRDLATRLAAADLRALGAALSGGPWGAEAGTLTYMVSGPADVVDAVRPLLDATGSRTFVVSDREEVAQAAKLGIQLIYGVNMFGVFEALRLGATFGIDQDQLVELYCHSVADSWVARNWGHVREWWEGDSNGLDILVKDLRALLSEADKHALSLPVTSLSFDLMRSVWAAFGSSLPPPTHPARDPVAWT